MKTKTDTTPKDKPVKVEWEKEFDEKFVNFVPMAGFQQIHPNIDARTIKSFISSLLLDQEERVREETVEKIKKEWVEKDSPLTPYGEKLWNKLIKSIKSK